jgi:hypothetical protein
VNHIPPQLPPDLHGGLDLSPQAMPQAHTQRQVMLRGCNVQFQAVVDEDKIVRHYQLVILDPHEETTYILGFLKQVKDNLQDQLERMPDPGFAVPE